MRRGRVESGRVAPHPRATGKSYSQCQCTWVRVQAAFGVGSLKLPVLTPLSVPPPSAPQKRMMRSCFVLLLAVETNALADQSQRTSTSGPFQRSTGFHVAPTRRTQTGPEELVWRPVRGDGSGAPASTYSKGMHSEPCPRACTPRIPACCCIPPCPGLVQAATDLTMVALRVGTCALAVHHHGI